mgnify:CR=1 FL=1
MIETGTIREDGRRWDGYVWRKVGTNHRMNEQGLVFYKQKYRTLNGYLQQGGNISRLTFKNMSPKDIQIFSKALYDTKKAGDVYIIYNPAWEGWYKVGKAVEASNRLDGFQTSSPFRDYKLLFYKTFSDRNTAETVAHSKLNQICTERSFEWFKIDLQDAIDVIDRIQLAGTWTRKKRSRV